MLTAPISPFSNTAPGASRLQTPALMLAALLLTGCAYAPGMVISKGGVASTTAQANPYSITTQRAATPAGAAASGSSSNIDAPPPGALLRITPELIR
ncbi:MAG: hypothetical protein MUP33_13125, partial [Polaromonas sp.]|nr:hypothetical protein [Polaromonas sp.]